MSSKMAARFYKGKQVVCLLICAGSVTGLTYERYEPLLLVIPN